jgi:uncharacterized membrane protein YphA (DoxX/SURF4 family)
VNVNRLLWIVQISLALIFLTAGSMKLISTDALLATQFLLPPSFIRLIGGLEILGALGLVLPCLTRIRTGLTPIAAAGLTIIMVGAVTTTLTSGTPGAGIPLVLGLLAAFVTYGRWRLSPLPERAGTGAPQAA